MFSTKGFFDADEYIAYVKDHPFPDYNKGLNILIDWLMVFQQIDPSECEEISEKIKLYCKDEDVYAILKSLYENIGYPKKVLNIHSNITNKYGKKKICVFYAMARMLAPFGPDDSIDNRDKTVCFFAFRENNPVMKDIVKNNQTNYLNDDSKYVMFCQAPDDSDSDFEPEGALDYLLQMKQELLEKLEELEKNLKKL